MELNISPITEKQFCDTLMAIEREAEFDLWVELYKTGIITKGEFIEKAEYYVPNFHRKKKEP